MKTPVIQDEPDAARGGTVTAPPAPPAGAGTARTRQPPAGGRGTFPLVAGAVALLVALALLASGAAALGALGNRDGDGYFMTSAHQLSTPSGALVSERIDIDADAPDWVFGERSATSRIEASSSRPVFVGIGPSADVERYLGRVRHAEITDLDTDPFRVTSHLVPGRAQAAPPASQEFWRVQASGPGARTVTWPLESGQWSVVVMNADGSPNVDVQARFGARIPFLRWVAIGLLAGGAAALLAGLLLLRLGTSRRRAAAR